MAQQSQRRQVSIQINGHWLRGFTLMNARFGGYDPLARRRFEKDELIAFKRLTPQEQQWLYGNGRKYDTIAILWDEAEDGPVGTSGEIKATGTTATNRPNFKPTEEQNKILNTVVQTNSHVEIKAYAGTGKTATLVWLVFALIELLKLPRRVIYLAYNTSIGEELSKRLQGTNCPARTTHSFGFAAIKATFGQRVEVDNRRYGNLFQELLCDKHGFAYSADSFQQVRTFGEYKLRSAVLELVSYVQNWAIVPNKVDGGWEFSDDQTAAALALFHDYEIEIPIEIGEDNRTMPIATPEEVVHYALAVVAKGIPQVGQKLNIVAFDDMVYLPIALRLALAKNELVLTDETQDFNRCQLLFLQRMEEDGARVIFVGDPNQALYRFRGADSKSFENIGRMLEATQRGLVRHILPKSWRNDKRIVRYCRKWVPDFDGYPEAEGTVETIRFGEALDRANNDSRDIELPDGIGFANRTLENCTFAFLCRINVPLVVTAYQLISLGKRCCIIGKSQIGEPLKRIICNLCNIKYEQEWTAETVPAPASDDEPMVNRLTDVTDADGKVTVQGFLSRLVLFHAAQANKFRSEALESKLEKLEQDVECLKVIAARVKDDKATSMILEIGRLFTENPEPGVIQLATVHRAKGLEWNVTFMLRPDLLPFPKVKTEEDALVETFCAYVGYSRAKNRSYMVEDWPFGNKSGDLAFERPEEYLGYPDAPQSEDESQGRLPAQPEPVRQVTARAEVQRVAREIGQQFTDDGEPF